VVGELDAYREGVRADAPLDVVAVRRRQRRRVVAGRRRRERDAIAVEVPGGGGAAGDLGRDGDAQRGREARSLVHDGVAVGDWRRRGG
jgi:hypothetical protein